MVSSSHARRFTRHFTEPVTIERYQTESTGPRGGRQYAAPEQLDALVEWTYEIVESPSGDSKVSTLKVHLPGEAVTFGPNDRITLANGRVHHVLYVQGVSGSGLVTLGA